MAGTSLSLLPRARFLLLLLHAVLLALLSRPTLAEQVLIGNRTLYAGQSLYSSSRNYRLIMEWDCTLALYELQKPVWASTAVRQLPGGSCHATLNADSALLKVVQSNTNKQVWSSTKTINPVNFVLVLQNDLNVVIYQRPVWSTETGVPEAEFQNGDQILLASGTLRVGQFLYNSDLNFRFIMQEDCNLVLYDDDRRIWSSETSGKGTGCYAKLDSATGQLVIRDDCKKIVWTSTNRVPVKKHILLLQPDRNVVVYTGRIWATDTSIPENEEGLQGAGRIDMVTN